MENQDAIAIYSRKSKFTGKGESIGNQVELCKDYIMKMYGQESAGRCVVFEDEGFSGGNLKRPDFQKMMAQVRRRRFKAIVVYRLDRISRNISDFAGLIEELTRLGVSFVSIREQFDTATPMGRAMMFIISVFSQLERETIAERIRDNMHELAKTGRWLGGNAPLGFCSQEESKVTVDGKTRKSFRLVPVEQEAEIPKMIFDLYTQTDSLTAVEAELLRRRIKTRQGKDFTRFSIKGILRNPVYMMADEEAYHYFVKKEAEVCVPKDAFDGSRGIMAYNRTDQEKGKATVLLPVSQWIVALGAHPGLISSSQWIGVQESLDRNRSRAYRKPRTNEALLTGLVYCACGERMYPRLSGRKTPEGVLCHSYVCAMKERSKGQRCQCPNLSGNALDSAVLAQIKRLSGYPDSLLSRLEKSRRLYAGDSQQSRTWLTALRAEYGSNEKTIGGLIDSLGMVGDSVARPRVLGRLEELTRINEDIARQIQELQASSDEGTMSCGELDALGQSLSQFSATVDGMSVEEKRRAMGALISKIVWDGVYAHVTLTGTR